MLSDGGKAANSVACSCDACRVSWQTKYDPTERQKGIAVGSPIAYGIDQDSRDKTTLERLVDATEALTAAINNLASRL